MRKTIFKILLALVILFLPGIELISKIIIKRDEKGNIVISNTPAADSQGAKATRLKNPSTSASIPQEYLEKIKSMAQKYQLSEQLITAVARAESDFNPLAVSHKGAVGIMQLMHQTALDYGVNNRYDVDQNLEAGVQHLKYLYEKYKHNIPLTLAAYNAGEEAVKKYQGVPPYQETRVYIRRVMEYMGLNYSGYFNSGLKSKIYKYVTKDGQIIITDTLPAKIDGTVIILD